MATPMTNDDFLKNLLYFTRGTLCFDSKFHGADHWLRVERNAMSLVICGLLDADILVCRAFALIHDCKREEDGYDEEHGRRSGMMVRAIENMNLPWWGLNHRQTMELAFACEEHTVARNTPGHGYTLTQQVCFDADRLDLGRVGLWPDPEYLFTHRAKIMASAWNNGSLVPMLDQLCGAVTDPGLWVDTPLPEDED